MTHVTIVQVQESHLKQVSRNDVLINENQNSQTSIATHTHQNFKTEFEPKEKQSTEVVYVNVMELRQNMIETPQEKVTATKASNTERQDILKVKQNKRLSRKSSIMNQNVGVTGGVFMKSDPKGRPINYSDEESDSSLTESESSLSGSDSGLSSTIEVGTSPEPKHSTTITIGEEITSDKGILLHVSPKSLESSSEDEEIPNSGHHNEIISVEYSNFEVSDDLSEAAVTLEWRVIPPSHPVLRQHISFELEGDRGSTPTSFSSAYTVTEHENESTSEESEISRHNWSSQESDEDGHDIPNLVNQLIAERSPSFNEGERLGGNGESEESGEKESQTNHNGLSVCNLSTDDQVSTLETHIIPTISDHFVKEAVLSAVPTVLRRLRHTSESSSSGEESIVYSYIPCRDQREKEDEELWVANEAADPRGAQGFQGTTPPLIPPPIGWGGSLGRVTGKTKADPGIVESEQQCGVDACGSNPSCMSSIMCTVAPTITSSSQVGGVAGPRRHYSTRQRNAETQIIKFKVVDEEHKYKENQNTPSDSIKKQNKIENTKLPTSTMTCKPTKRFSFLVRSNSSVKEEEEKTGQKKATVIASRTPCPLKGLRQAPSQTLYHQFNSKKSVTPSDQAILDKLATLNIETPSGVATKIKPRCSVFDPPCARCGDPVYPQERTEPTLKLVFHSSCFKCNHCGVRLTLKTFFRSPVDSKDTRVFCRSHVPTLDPGKLDLVRSDTSSSGKSSPDCVASDSQSDSSRTSNSSPSMCIQDQLEIVKCDTIGLRYF